MQTLSPALYRYHQDSSSQYQAGAMEMVAGYVFDCQLKQGHLLGGAGTVNWCHSANGLANGTCDSPNDGFKRSDAGLLQGIVELDESYVGGDPH